jgi:hypothetical protein
MLVRLWLESTPRARRGCAVLAFQHEGNCVATVCTWVAILATPAGTQCRTAVEIPNSTAYVQSHAFCAA